jgi:hypothetical protein
MMPGPPVLAASDLVFLLVKLSEQQESSPRGRGHPLTSGHASEGSE